MRTFNDAWVASQPKEVQAVLQLDESARPAAALDLAMRGVPVDMAIVVFGSAPYFVHMERTFLGCPYVGSLRMLGADPAGAEGTGQSPLWVPQPWDYTKLPKGALATVFIDQDDDAGNLRRLDAIYPPPPPVVAAPITTVNPIGYFFGPSVRRDYTGPDGVVYKNCLIYSANAPNGVNGEKYLAPSGKQFILGITDSIIGQTKLWYQIN